MSPRIPHSTWWDIMLRIIKKLSYLSLPFIFSSCRSSQTLAYPVESVLSNLSLQPIASGYLVCEACITFYNFTLLTSTHSPPSDTKTWLVLNHIRSWVTKQLNNPYSLSTCQRWERCEGRMKAVCRESALWS